MRLAVGGILQRLRQEQKDTKMFNQIRLTRFISKIHIKTGENVHELWEWVVTDNKQRQPPPCILPDRRGELLLVLTWAGSLGSKRHALTSLYIITSLATAMLGPGRMQPTVCFVTTHTCIQLHAIDCETYTDFFLWLCYISVYVIGHGVTEKKKSQ